MINLKFWKKKREFEDFETTSGYIRKIYGGECGFRLGMGYVRLGNSEKLTQKLIENKKLTVPKLLLMKNSINAQFDLYKSLSFLSNIIATIFTAIMGLLTFIITLAFKVIDFKTEKPDPKKYMDVVGDILSTSVVNVFIVMITIIYVLVILYIFRFRWISHINNIVESVYETKKKREEEREANSYSSKTEYKQNEDLGPKRQINSRRKK